MSAKVKAASTRNGAAVVRRPGIATTREAPTRAVRVTFSANRVMLLEKNG